jgi:hypothetical protein
VKNPAKIFLLPTTWQLLESSYTSEFDGEVQMAEYFPETDEAIDLEQTFQLKFLKPSQVSMIDEALDKVGEFGEVRLVIERGRLRFLVTEKSFDVLKWTPGSLGR